jgi:hypothetical protein
MAERVKPGDWVWVVMEERQTGQVNLLGQFDKKKEVQFVPVFLSKEEALQCLPFLHKAADARYEVQAMPYEDVSKNAVQHDFLLFVVDGRGNILEEIVPTAPGD